MSEAERIAGELSAEERDTLLRYYEMDGDESVVFRLMGKGLLSRAQIGPSPMDWFLVRTHRGEEIAKLLKKNAPPDLSGRE